MVLGCGSPVASWSWSAGNNNLTYLQGERILDLGSRFGMDVLLAASKVGATGQAIGLDMSSVR